MPGQNILQKITEIRSLLDTDPALAKRRALSLYESAALKPANTQNRAELYHLMGLVALHHEEQRDAQRWFDKELNLRKKVTDDKGAAAALNNLGAICFRQGKLEKALLYHQEALGLREKLNDRKGIVSSCINLGAVMYETGRTEESIQLYYKALTLEREDGEIKRMSISLQNIGLAYMRLGDHKYALENFKESLSIAQSNEDYSRSVQLMINLGALNMKMHKTTEARKYFLQCYELSKETDYRHGQLLALHNLAELNFDNGRYKDAVRQFSECAEIAEGSGYRSEHISALLSIGRCRFQLNEPAAGLEHIQQALKLAKKASFKSLVCDCYEHLALIHERNGDFGKALEHYKKYVAIRDVLQEKEKQRAISELKTRYEVEKREKEFILLREKNEAISQYTKKLESSNNELRQFAHVASHDLREPLRMISSYLDLLIMTSEGQLNEEQKMFMKFAKDGALRMGRLISDLLSLARIDFNPKLELVPLDEVLAEVKSNLSVLLKEKHARIYSPKLPVIRGDRTQLGQLLQNLIGNGIKYNESAKPMIHLKYETGSLGLKLSVADNGIGIPAEFREIAFHIFRRLPTVKEYQGSGIGLSICKKIVEGLGGDISLSDNPGGGTVVFISLPVSVLP